MSQPSNARQIANEVSSQARDAFNAGVQAAESFRKCRNIPAFVAQVQQNQIMKATAKQAHEAAIKVEW